MSVIKIIYFVSHKCCEFDSNATDSTEMMATAKNQCLTETRKNRQKNNASDDDVIQGDGGLYNMFSCDRINQWKTLVTCTIDCMAKKLGVVKIPT